MKDEDRGNQRRKPEEVRNAYPTHRRNGAYRGTEMEQYVGNMSQSDTNSGKNGLDPERVISIVIMFLERPRYNTRRLGWHKALI